MILDPDALAAALTKYHQALTKYATGDAKETSDPIRVERLRMLLSCRATAHFLEELGFDKSIYERFAIWSTAIHDLDIGTTAPFLKATKFETRPGDPSYVWGTRGRVAVAVECLLRAGKSRSEAGAAIRKRTKLVKLLRPGTELSTSALNWRDKLNSRKNPNLVAMCAWEAGLSLLNRQPPLRAAELIGLAKRLLDTSENEAARLLENQ